MNAAFGHCRRIGCDENGEPWAGHIDDNRRFHARFRAQDEDIDELGHVNNAVWVKWIQEVSVAHWLVAARVQDRDRFVAVVMRHEIDYRGNIAAGDEISAITWLDGAPRGARYQRSVAFLAADSRVIVSAHSRWALLDRASLKPVRILPEVSAPFLDHDGQGGVPE